MKSALGKFKNGEGCIYFLRISVEGKIFLGGDLSFDVFLIGVSLGHRSKIEVYFREFLE